MSYVQENLLPNEKILFQAKLNPAIFLAATSMIVSGIIMMFIALTIPDKINKLFSYIAGTIFFLIAIKSAIEAIIMIATTEFAITNKRIVAKTGFIHRTTLEMLLPKIESVSVYQNILGRWMDFGNITITGTGGTKETFKAIINPIDVRKKINQVIEHYTEINNQISKRTKP